uniref:Rna-directed dna polymerase from mobile element jockey-like protein n=1 Tax=Triatoma infestans TaxID=30076 RepID=A0A161MAG8_TRIIF
MFGIDNYNTLTWNGHVSNICKGVYKSLNQLKLYKSMLPIPLRKQLISTLIFPYFDYCCIVYNDLNAELNLK